MDTSGNLALTTLHPPEKILYMNTNFHKKLNSETYLKDCVMLLRDYYSFDWVLMPFFFSTIGDKRALMVTVEVRNCGVELYDKDREEGDEVDSKFNFVLTQLSFVDHDISDTVLHMMDLASKIADIDFSEDQIEGGVE